jgi:hypothetical protein
MDGCEHSDRHRGGRDASGISRSVSMNLVVNVTAPRPWALLAAIVVLTCAAFFSAADAYGDARSKARRIHDRIAGVPPSDAVLYDMVDTLNATPGVQGEINAAFDAMDNAGFYNVTLKNFVAPWTNRDGDVFVPLNDYTATVVGMVRENKDFREILYGDILFVGSSGTYTSSSNGHYQALEDSNADLSDDSVLVETTQSAVTSLPFDATAGVMTTRGAARAFFIDGTNRAMFRFTMVNHLCHDMEQVLDITRAADRIRQDVSRSPGGDSRVYLNNCIGCHSGMDPLAQAFAYYNFEYTSDPETGAIRYRDVGDNSGFMGTRVDPKYHVNNTTFEHGFITPDDAWDNYWRVGPNAKLGWDTNGLGAGALPGTGNGAKTLGMELANTEAFAQCQVTKVFENVCLRPPQDAADHAEIITMVSEFKADQGGLETGSYNLKKPFARAAAHCSGS